MRLHPWLKPPVVTRGLQLDGQDIGYTTPVTDSEIHPNQLGPLDGIIDPLAGHGTFIAGLSTKHVRRQHLVLADRAW